MTFEKCDEPLTFEDLYTKFNKKLVCSTYNLNTNKIEYLSLETTQNYYAFQQYECHVMCHSI